MCDYLLHIMSDILCIGVMKGNYQLFKSPEDTNEVCERPQMSENN